MCFVRRSCWPGEVSSMHFLTMVVRLVNRGQVSYKIKVEQECSAEAWYCLLFLGNLWLCQASITIYS
ncbi:hypothetical protein M758_1G333500 [Ceratodon purpureus]|uniref:Uncharacterized protein n=1 Tax=Ceratodon purpureus TaxID=3225 RepID=A0A8T0JCL1_CERPU|nr:hypothetical protein KC19_1G339400 [Ceratodon purpureus]KAG0632516.1 hypothetical protein M758_1G333500 [Ceratodon purpureus]